MREGAGVAPGGAGGRDGEGDFDVHCYEVAVRVGLGVGVRCVVWEAAAPGPAV